MYATIHFARSNGGTSAYTQVKALGQTVTGDNTFSIPVNIGENTPIQALTTAMSQPHWIDYVLYIAKSDGSDGTDGKSAADDTLDDSAPAITGLTALPAEGENNVQSDLVRLFPYEDDVWLIEVDIPIAEAEKLAGGRDGEAIRALLPERAPAVATVQEEKEAEPLYPPGTSNQELIAPVPETTPEAAAESLPAAAPPPAATPAVSAVPVETTPGAAALAAKHAATLRFVVSKEAWIEVRDSEQKVVFSQRLAPGSEQQVQGQGPLSVTVGYAPGVQLFLRGQQVDLAPHSRGDVARLVLE